MERSFFIFLSLLVAGSLPAQSNPILPGDHPDPTILRIGKTYWTTSTSGDWAPEFPLYKSIDLRHWTAVGEVFPQTPDWASGSFWAPELIFESGRVLVYYVGRKRDGPLCVAVATANRPEGPYTDHGPILCQPDGSIDPSFIRDEHGQPFLIWKEDGNSEGKPTPIFAQPLSGDLLHLTGEKTQLLINDPASWEGGVVEGPYILRHAHRFFLFYAANGCCGAACTYAEGVARAGRLLGPWEKDPANPIIPPNAAWKCPGHGTAVQTSSGRDFLLYHAYPAVGTVYLGRESILDAIDWNPDGWPVINGGHGPRGGVLPGQVAAAPASFRDDFTQAHLNPEWKWPIGHAPVLQAGSGRLTLQTAPGQTAAFLARSTLSAAYTAIVGVDDTQGVEAGLGMVGDVRNGVLLVRNGDQVQLVRSTGPDRKILWQANISPISILWLRVTANGPANASFSYSLDREHWTAAAPNVSLDGLPPWDQGLRVGLVVKGQPSAKASFVHFSLTDLPQP